MFKIGEFSKLGQVSVRMLRHYDQLGLLKPAVVDQFTDYRYYTIEQLPRLNRILALKDLGLSLEQIKDLLNEDLPPERLRGMLLLKQMELEQEIRNSQERLARLEARLERIEHEDEPSPYEVVVKSVEPITVAAIHQIIPSLQEMGFYCQSIYEQLRIDLNQANIEPVGPEITLYHHQEYTETDIEAEMSICVDKRHLPGESKKPDFSIRVLPAEEMMAALIYEGPYRDAMPAILDLMAWVGLNDCEISGPLRELHLSGPTHQNGQPVASAIVEYQMPIKKVERKGKLS